VRPQELGTRRWIEQGVTGEKEGEKEEEGKKRGRKRKRGNV
jgi:hypothetical protein